MEILIASISILTLTAIAVLIGTRGRPARLFTAFGETLERIWQNRGPMGWGAVCVALVLAFVFSFYASPATRIGAAQPIPFSHRLHASDKAIDCRFCHSYVDRSINPGMPPVEKCLFCHNYIIANHPEIRKEHNFYNTATPVPWVKVFDLPEHVFFNHERHIKKEIACESCHGPIHTMDRLKGTRFRMGFCLECHRQKNVNLDCWLTCHG